MDNFHPDYVIVLAAGKGSRMHSGNCPKVCFPVNGIPAINRALQNYRDCEISQAIVVVGTLAQVVMETVTPAFPQTLFAYQREQNGTANAIRCALEAMRMAPDDANLLIVAGDRLISKDVLEELFELYDGTQSALALLALRCDSTSSQGRILVDGQGAPQAIVEMADVRQQCVYDELRTMASQGTDSLTREDIRGVIRKIFFKGNDINDSKAEKAFGALWRGLQSDGELPVKEILEHCPAKPGFQIGDRFYSPQEIQESSLGNTSVYLVRKGVLVKALAELSRNNAQREEYLSDLVHRVRQVVPDMQVQVLTVEDKGKILGFNDPGELMTMERLLWNQEHPTAPPEPDARFFRPLRQWQQLLENDGDSRRQFLETLYGRNAAVQKRQLDIMRELLKCAANRFLPEQKLLLVRSPGRLNVMGRHVDHQGGNCNLMTISFETVCFAAPRQDDVITLTHCNQELFGNRQFQISQLIADLPWDDWDTLVSSNKLKKMIQEYGVDWSNYIQAAVLRLQKRFPHIPLRGMDMVIGGNIPMAAGLSSSSSLLVGAAEAVVAINHLDVRPAQLVNLCGEGEWFVGTHGGSADHAAVKLGQRGSVVKVRFFNFGIEESVPFPEGYSMIVCDSGIKARKSSNARDQFNHRISCYRIGFLLIRKYFPQYAPIIEHLRDVSTAHLKVPLSQIYKILLTLPENATIEELSDMLPETDLTRICAGHCPPADGRYPIRGVVLFGLAEMQRSAQYAHALKNGNMEYIGELMRISHDGDRVASFDDQWRETRFSASCDNAYIMRQLDNLESGDVERVMEAQLCRQSGAYGCSIPAIDKMVDIANRTPGVLGAQLAGAGLGGCMMILAHDSAVEALHRNLVEQYYRPAGLPETVLVCTPIAGAGCVSLLP